MVDVIRLLLGGLYDGFFSPTEAAAVGNPRTVTLTALLVAVPAAPVTTTL